MESKLTQRLVRSLCTAGLLFGTLLFAASLSPSLLPRPPLLQGVISGLAFAAGYAIGFWTRWLWQYLELPVLSGWLDRLVRIAASLFCLAVAAFFLWRMGAWQDSVRDLMGMAPTDGVYRIQVALVAAAVFAVLLILARLFMLTSDFASRSIRRHIPRRVSHVLGLVVAVVAFWSVVDGVIFRLGLRMADSSYQQLDAVLDPAIERPTDPLRTGSPASLVAWRDLGRMGRRFIAETPSAETLSATTGNAAMVPLRVYVGLNAAETVEARADLALAELKRVGAFARSVLIVATPTGTGMIDRAAIAPVEHLLGGDVATVAVQYSYLSSWLALLTEPGYGAETAQALFDRVYGHWTGLPEDARPRLYLHGLSLGALNSDLSFDLFDVIGDPLDGAVWSGPPFATPTWRSATLGREPDSPAWLPRFRDGSVIRFANQHGLAEAGADWGPMRIVYLQYASDPITFFEPRMLYRRPEWLDPPRGPDVSPDLRWYPVVTFLQLIADMPVSMAAPVGYGHVFAPGHYLDAWRAVLDVPEWDDDAIERLAATLSGSP
jgi:uncharacterized membrane protein